MTRSLLKLLFVIAALAVIVQSKAVVLTDSIKSEVLGAWLKYNVYYPESYDPSGAKKYPMLYLLHGLTDTYEGWHKNGQVDEVADELLAEGKIGEMVIIMPNAGGPDTHNTWNGYFNMPGWNYYEFFFQELMPEVEKKYNAIGDKQHRAISGLSMGGGGSTVYALRNPELFSSCYAMSSRLHDDRQPSADKEDKLNYYYLAGHEYSAITYVEQADKETLKKLRSVKWFFDVGDDDNLLEQSEKLHALMRYKRVKAELRVRDGAHNWRYWHSALYTSLPFIYSNFENKQQ